MLAFCLVDDGLLSAHKLIITSPPVRRTEGGCIVLLWFAVSVGVRLSVTKRRPRITAKSFRRGAFIFGYVLNWHNASLLSKFGSDL